jgi:hypothetical protein
MLKAMLSCLFLVLVTVCFSTANAALTEAPRVRRAAAAAVRQGHPGGHGSGAPPTALAHDPPARPDDLQLGYYAAAAATHRELVEWKDADGNWQWFFWLTIGMAIALCLCCCCSGAFLCPQ